MKYFLIMACFGLLGCQDHHSSKQLKLREQQISQREKDFSLKLADDQRLLEMERSLPAKRDTFSAIPNVSKTSLALLPDASILVTSCLKSAS
ncbi:hypothetical protein [Dyadobacter bucti]|uniref:hypothetical protein n=1 Tax=Dyadobacter bucti TaxID=2572203 RepID=UPI003F71F64C